MGDVKAVLRGGRRGSGAPTVLPLVLGGLQQCPELRPSCAAWRGPCSTSGVPAALLGFLQHFWGPCSTLGAPAALWGLLQSALGFGGRSASPWAVPGPELCAHRGVFSASQPELRLQNSATAAGGAQMRPSGAPISRRAAPGGGRAALAAPARRCVPIRHPGTPSVPATCGDPRSERGVPSPPGVPGRLLRTPGSRSRGQPSTNELRVEIYCAPSVPAPGGLRRLPASVRPSVGGCGCGDARSPPRCRPEAVRSFSPQRPRVAPGADTALRAAPSVGLSAFPGGRRNFVRTTAPLIPPNPGTLGWSRSVRPSVPLHASIRPQVRRSWKVTAKGRGDGDGDGKGGASHTEGTKPDGDGRRGVHPRGRRTGPEPSRGGRETGVAVPLLRGRAGRHGCAALGPRQPRAASGGVGHGAHGAREQCRVGGVGRNNGGSCGRGAEKKKKESSGKIPVLGPWQRCPDPPRPMDYCTKKCYFCFNNLLRRWNSNAGFVLSSEGALFLQRPRSARGLRGRPHPPLPEVSPRPGCVSPPPRPPFPQPRRGRSPRAVRAAPGGPHPRFSPAEPQPGAGGGRRPSCPHASRGARVGEDGAPGGVGGGSGRRSAPGDALKRILPIQTGTGTSSPSHRPSVGDGDRAGRCRRASPRGSGMAEPGGCGGGSGGGSSGTRCPGAVAPWERHRGKAPGPPAAPEAAGAGQ